MMREMPTAKALTAIVPTAYSLRGEARSVNSIGLQTLMLSRDGQVREKGCRKPLLPKNLMQVP